ncbi:hypothetical protein B0H14DRAFT_3452316 [Mycena olivaceomarginata]|nr:hypothetical protein B0H14DRAFT_3452316 [Mycena olivaceomarginata]
MAKKAKAPAAETIDQLEARLAEMKKAAASQPEKRSRGRPKGSKNKPKTLMTDAKGDTKSDTSHDANTKKLIWKHDHKLTDSLLTTIELSGPRRQAFGFTKGDLDTAGNTTSQTQDAHCERLALKVLVNHPSGHWETVDPKDLVFPVRSRITMLKNNYQKHKKSLGETGFGIMVEDREEELYGDLQNVWEKIQEDFPWFRRMHARLDGSPIHDTDACTNSNDSLDTKLFASALDAEIAQNDGSSIIVVDDEADVSSAADVDIKSTLSNDDLGAVPKAGKAAVKTEKMATTAKPAVIANPVSKPIVGAAPKRKRDTMLDMLKDIVGHDHQSKQELPQMSHKAKRQRTEMELKYKAAEVEKARAHELQTLKLKIQLAQINSGVWMPSMHPAGSSEPSLPF